ncbi:MAG: heavy-metal-associated domain-containing protein [Erysipelotrichaceae bacterium]|nr:heavy-metal-associated domain-containing protein [Erysipelotrichaceae bacterium]
MIRTTVRIEGMACGMCEAHVNETIRRHFEVRKVTSSFRKGACEIIADKEISLESLKEALDPTGYPALSVTYEEYKKKGLFG